MSDRYILDEKGNPVAEPNLAKWAEWFKAGERTVKKEDVGDCTVSTVFLGLDRSFGYGPPLLWETMVFGGVWDEEQDRCSGNKGQAEAMHQRMVERVKNEKPDQ